MPEAVSRPGDAPPNSRRWTSRPRQESEHEDWSPDRPSTYKASNAAAEAFNSLFKAELVRIKGPWRSIKDLELAVAEYIDWFNHRRLHGEIGTIPPVELEDHHYWDHPVPTDYRGLSQERCKWLYRPDGQEESR
jgi:transposase InsO family protein